jgi:hypothetical protein
LLIDEFWLLNEKHVTDSFDFHSTINNQNSTIF